MTLKWRNYLVIEAFCNGTLSIDEAVTALVTKKDVTKETKRISLLRFFDLRSAEKVGNVDDEMEADVFKTINA